MHGYSLIAANEIEGKRMLQQIDGLVRGGTRLLLDSGIFWLTNQHKVATVEEALGSLRTSAG